MKHFQLICIAITLFLTFGYLHAKENSAKTVYKEIEFIQLVNGKSREDVMKILGKPARKSTPVMPTNAAQIVHDNAQITTPHKKDTIEMWHYANLVSYTAKKTYKRTELTFINNKCSNITYIN